MKKQNIFILIAALLFVTLSSCNKGNVYKTLIITGQGEHNWKVSSPILKQILDETGLFDCKIMTTPEKGGDMSSFKPNFSRYKLVVLDYNGDPWPESTNQKFVDYVKNGGGVVIYHGSSLSFPDWKEYNDIIGLGGGNNKSGAYVYYNRRNEMVIDTSAGVAGSIGKAREFVIRTRITDHPITKGLPVTWVHGSDELIQQLRGNASSTQVLATGQSARPPEGTGRDEPVLMVINYDKGRIFNTTLGHADDDGGPAVQCVGFIVTLQRGAEWAASGQVTQEIPFDFPTAAGPMLRTDYKPITLDDAFANIGTYEIGKSTKYFICLQSHIRKAAGDAIILSGIEKRMADVLKDPQATNDSKKLILRELSWMGSEYSIPVIKSLSEVPELKDDVNFALTRLQ
jgi:type 1 glutamine amidotransferase